ncbi:MAG: lipopolysaccharide heptosyltransferase I [Hyphomicrobiales bacterium]|nr:lipopolysaccharide heptosyltransferase I [Hyphomicrobiales bacterium]
MSEAVLFVKTSSLGDVVHHMPALTEARTRRPDCRFAWVVEEDFAPLVRLHPAVGDVIPVASRRWRRSLPGPALWRELAQFKRTLRAQAYDVVVDSQGLLRSALIARAARGPRHGYDAASIRERMATLFYDVRHPVARGAHAIARNRVLTGLALGYAPEGPPDYGLDRSALAPPASAPYAVLLHATAQPGKEWPLPRWIDLARALNGLNIRAVLPWGNAREHRRSRAIALALPCASIPDRQPLDRLARLLAGASLVAGVDTGLLHLAAALGVPLAAIFVASDPVLTGPVGRGPIATLGGRGAMPSSAEVIRAVERIVQAPAP